METNELPEAIMNVEDNDLRQAAEFGYRLGLQSCEELKDKLKRIEPEYHSLRSYQGMTVDEQNKMIEDVERLQEQLKAKDDVIFTHNLERGLIEHQGKTILRQAEQIDSLTKENERLREALNKAYNHHSVARDPEIEALLTETKPE